MDYQRRVEKKGGVTHKNKSKSFWERYGLLSPEEREEMGLRPYKPGIVRCLCCGGEFESPDRVKIRMCDHCREKEVSDAWEGWNECVSLQDPVRA